MNQPKIYRKRSKVIIKTVIKVLIGVMLAFIILSVSLFFYLRKYVVYDDTGAHIVFNKSAAEDVQPAITSSSQTDDNTQKGDK